MAWLNQNQPPDGDRAMAGNVPVRESDPSSPRSEIGFSAPLPENMRLLNLDENSSQSQQDKRKSGQEHEDLSSGQSSMPPLSSSRLESPVEPQLETICETPRESPLGASANTTEHPPIQADTPNDEGIACRHRIMREKTESTVDSGEGISLRDYSDLSNSWGSVSSVTHCHECEIYRQGFPSSESYDFWKSIDNHPNCHMKYFNVIVDRLIERFPDDNNLLNDKKMKNFLRAILHAEESNDAAQVNLKDYLRLVRFFGPVCEDKNNHCILLSQLKIIIEKSLIPNMESRRREKISWFAGDINRETSKKLLRDQRDGTFLVRMSKSEAERGTFVVSIKHDCDFHHFEITGHPDDAVQTCTSNEYSANLEWKGRRYSNLPEVIDVVRAEPLHDDDDGESEVIFCRRVCPDLPLNAQICGYKKAKR